MKTARDKRYPKRQKKYRKLRENFKSVGMAGSDDCPKRKT